MKPSSLITDSYAAKIAALCTADILQKGVNMTMKDAATLAAAIMLLASCADAREPAENQASPESSSPGNTFQTLPAYYDRVVEGLGYTEAWALEDLDLLTRDNGTPLNWTLDTVAGVVRAESEFTADDGIRKSFVWVFGPFEDGTDLVPLKETRVDGRQQLPETTAFVARLYARKIAEAYYPEKLESASEEFIDLPN